MKRRFYVYECGSDDDDDVFHPTSGRMKQYPTLNAVMAEHDITALEYDRSANVWLNLTYDYHCYAMGDELWLIVHDK